MKKILHLMTIYLQDEALSLLSNLLTKARSLQKLTRNTNNILQIESNIRVEFIKDFKIRWNYTYKFLDHMLQYKSILFDLTCELIILIKFKFYFIFYSKKDISFA